MMAQAKIIYILSGWVTLAFFFSQCFTTEIENIFSVLLSDERHVLMLLACCHFIAILFQVKSAFVWDLSPLALLVLGALLPSHSHHNSIFIDNWCSGGLPGNFFLRLQGRSQKKLMTEAMSMEDLWLRQSVHGWVLFLGIKSVYSDKRERNYRGKCLGWPVTSYGGGLLSLTKQKWLFFLCNLSIYWASYSRFIGCDLNYNGIGVRYHCRISSGFLPHTSSG